MLLSGCVVVGLLAGCGHGSTNPRFDLTGHWQGQADIPTTGLPTPLNMDLVDTAGSITGSGGGVDCRYFTTCGTFWMYTVVGTHDDRRVTLRGTAPENRTWTLTGTMGDDGRSMSGTVSSPEFPTSPCRMARQ